MDHQNWEWMVTMLINAPKCRFGSDTLMLQNRLSSESEQIRHFHNITYKWNGNLNSEESLSLDYITSMETSLYMLFTCHIVTKIYMIYVYKVCTEKSVGKRIRWRRLVGEYN
jgi:hypothetical protein